MKSLALVLMLALPSAAAAQVTADTPNPLAGNADAARAGAELFERRSCGGCHGYALEGGASGPDLTDEHWQYGGKPGEIFHTIAEGTGGRMPPWKRLLTPEEIWQLVAYIQSKHVR